MIMILPWCAAGAWEPVVRIGAIGSSAREECLAEGAHPADRTGAMAQVTFTQNIQRHVACPTLDVPGKTVREVLERYFEQHPRARGYVLDEQGALRKHVVIFLNGQQIRDRSGLSEAVETGSSIYVMQALSGG